MSKEKIEKTNAMRQLDRGKIPYRVQEYVYDEKDLSGERLSELNHLPEERVYKTIVLKGNRTGYLVVDIPSLAEIDLKKVARISGNKSVELVNVADLEHLTGYVRGGCSPVGMKKEFPKFIDEGVLQYQEIYISAGKRGLQLLIDPKDLIRFEKITVGDLIQK